jgi:hypothetical protein
MPNPESNISQVRNALKSFQGLMEEPYCELSIDDIVDITGFFKEQIRRMMDNNAILPRGEKCFLLYKGTPVDYGDEARGPFEVNESTAPEDMTGIRHSRVVRGVRDDPTDKPGGIY